MPDRKSLYVVGCHASGSEYDNLFAPLINTFFTSRANAVEALRRMASDMLNEAGDGARADFILTIPANQVVDYAADYAPDEPCIQEFWLDDSE